MTQLPTSSNGSTPGGENADPPLPTDAELRQRSSLLHQAWRFVVLNLKILKLSRQH